MPFVAIQLMYKIRIQSTLIISTSIISNNHLSRSEILVPVLTWKSKKRKQNIVEKRSNFSSFPQYFQYIYLRSNFSSFPQFFQYISIFRSQITYSFVKGGCSIYCFPHFCNSYISDISKCFRESLRIRDNENRLYFIPYNFCLFFFFLCIQVKNTWWDGTRVDPAQTAHSRAV